MSSIETYFIWKACEFKGTVCISSSRTVTTLFLNPSAFSAA
jgi:hypothetical protein